MSPIDLSSHIQFIFDFIYSIFSYLNSLTFTAFGFTFSYLGIFVAFNFLVLIIKFLKFGFQSSASESIRFSRNENKKNNEYVPRHAYKPKHSSDDYVPRHGG